MLFDKTAGFQRIGHYLESDFQHKIDQSFQRVLPEMFGKIEKEEEQIMNKCPRCGYRQRGDETYCAECGYRLSQASMKEYYGRGLRRKESSKGMIIMLSAGLVLVIILIGFMYAKMISLEKKTASGNDEGNTEVRTENDSTEGSGKEATEQQATIEASTEAGHSDTAASDEKDHHDQGLTPDELIEQRMEFERQREQDRTFAEDIYNVIEDKYYNGSAAEQLLLRSYQNKVVILSDTGSTDTFITDLLKEGVGEESIPAPAYTNMGASVYSMKITDYDSIQIYAGTAASPDQWRLYPVTDERYMP